MKDIVITETIHKNMDQLVDKGNVQCIQQLDVN